LERAPFITHARLMVIIAACPTWQDAQDLIIALPGVFAADRKSANLGDYFSVDLQAAPLA